MANNPDADAQVIEKQSKDMGEALDLVAARLTSAGPDPESLAALLGEPLRALSAAAKAVLDPEQAEPHGEDDGR